MSFIRGIDLSSHADEKVHMNMGPIFHITGDMRSTIFEIELR